MKYPRAGTFTHPIAALSDRDQVWRGLMAAAPSGPGSRTRWPQLRPGPAREPGVEQLLRLRRAVRGMQQHHAQPPPPAAGGGDEALAGRVGEARLDPVGARIAEQQQRIVVVEVELAALDREGQDRAARSDDAGQERLVQELVRDQREVLGA